MESATGTQLAAHRSSLTCHFKTNAEYFARHKGELKQLSEFLHELVNKNKRELIFIASRKCHDKMKWSEENLGKTACHQKFPNVLIFQANADILQYLSKQLILGTILYGNPDKVMTIIKKTKYSLGKLPTVDRDNLTNIIDICGLPNDQIVVAHKGTKTLTLLDQHYKIVSQCCA
ncbi:hypothetical protein DPMN_000104 [Dreissena polymorpha]|uniref:Uncharacterized protein n=1 Tax=Dreissena polymorpha TaxID=45954 RepID=A0A9D4MJ18_DREPO|nr:hypothetical protein DPMN_000104 [Dreissena polymorpha]